MSILSALSRFFMGATVSGSAYDYRPRIAERVTPVELPPSALYAVLRAMFLNNGAYEELARSHFRVGASLPPLKSIRNPVPAVVSILGSKLFPDPLVVTTPLTEGVTGQVEREKIEARDPIKGAIEYVHRWSNWERGSREFARQVALFGESYLKCIASQERGRVYFEIVSPEYVTEFEDDERGYLTSIRLDIPRVEERKEGRRYFTHTEAWQKDTLSYRRWETDGDASGRTLDELGTPDEEADIRTFGIDFLPFSRAVFSGIGDKRGIGAVQLALESIIEADLAATNLHSMVYTDAEGAWVATASGTDANGRTVPALRVKAAEPQFDALGRETVGVGRQSDGSISVGKRSFWSLPGGHDLKSVVPDIDYAGALAILQDHDAHLERLMPAMAYLRISEMSGADLSGRAITYKMRAFEDQVREGRANLLAALKQADMMALTMGAAIGVFPDLGGTYESGAFAHGFMDQPILPVSSIDDAEEQRTRAQAAQALVSAGVPMSYVLTDVLELTEERAAELVELAADEAEQAMERAAQLEPERTDDDGDEGEGA